MKKLVKGIVEFRKGKRGEKQELFQELAAGQKPDVLFIACADSRVVPNLFASTDPGDLFVVRNVGNLVPPAPAEETSVAAAVEFAVLSLGVTDIVVCGHAECGAMKALLDEVKKPPHLADWIGYGKGALKLFREGFTVDPELSEVNQLSQVNVLEQMKNIESYPDVKAQGVRVHGWWFDIEHANVYCYEEERKAFVLIDEAEAEQILKRLG